MRFSPRNFYFLLTVAAFFLHPFANAQIFSVVSVPVKSVVADHFSMIPTCDTTLTYFPTMGGGLLKGIGYAFNRLETVNDKGAIQKLVKLSSPDFPKPLAAFQFAVLDKALYAFTLLAKKGEASEI